MMLEITSQIVHLTILVHLNTYNSVFSKPRQACTFLLRYPLSVTPRFPNSVNNTIIRVFNVKRNVTLPLKHKQSKVAIYQKNPVKNSFISQRKIISKSTTLFNNLWHYGLNKNNLKENLNPKRFNNVVHKTIRNNGKQSKNPHPVTYQSDPKTTHVRVNSHQQLILVICTLPTQRQHSNRRGQISHSIIISI